jgi:hypothetical protein
MFEGRTLKVKHFLDRQRVTGLLIIKDGEILVGAISTRACPRTA